MEGYLLKHAFAFLKQMRKKEKKQHRLHLIKNAVAYLLKRRYISVFKQIGLREKR